MFLRENGKMEDEQKASSMNGIEWSRTRWQSVQTASGICQAIRCRLSAFLAAACAAKSIRARRLHRIAGWINALLTAAIIQLVVFLPVLRIHAQIIPSSTLAERVLTNIAEIWVLPQEVRNQPHRIKTEVLVYYFDRQWMVAWGECQGKPTYLPIGDCPITLKPGQRVEIDGVVEPGRKKFLWDRTHLRVIQDPVELQPSDISSFQSDPSRLHGLLGFIDGLVDNQTEKEGHLTLSVIASNTPVVVRVILDPQSLMPGFRAGDLIRIKGVLEPKLDDNGKLKELQMWVAQLDDIRKIGSLKDDPRFALAPISIESIEQGAPTNVILRVEGIVHKQEPGETVTLWDATGQILIRSRQTMPLHPGDPITAIGHPFVSGVQKWLRDALYIAIEPAGTNAMTPTSSSAGCLRLAEQVRSLASNEAIRQPKVDLFGVVTWFNTNTPFVYVQDASGGVLVDKPAWIGNGNTPQTAGSMVRVRGKAASGDFVPKVIEATLDQTGWWGLEFEPMPLTFEQAITGVYDGKWIQMSGLVRNITYQKGMVRLELSTQSGEFEVWTGTANSFENIRGSVIKVSGVCMGIANQRHQITGIKIWVPESRPESRHIQIQELVLTCIV
jgi:hypothetical protein